MPGGSCKNLSPPCTLAVFYRGFAKEGNTIYLSGNRGKLGEEEILGMSQHRPGSKAGQELQPSNPQLFWDLWHSESHQWIMNTPSIFLFTQKHAKMDNSCVLPCHLFPSAFPGERELWFVSRLLNSKDRCCCDVAQKHCTAQNFSSHWWISCSVERNWARKRSQPASNIISLRYQQSCRDCWPGVPQGSLFTRDF